MSPLTLKGSVDELEVLKDSSPPHSPAERRDVEHGSQPPSADSG